MNNWAFVVFFAVLVLPMVGCQINADTLITKQKIACIEAKGDWSGYMGGSCEFSLPSE